MRPHLTSGSVFYTPCCRALPRPQKNIERDQQGSQAYRSLQAAAGDEALAFRFDRQPVPAEGAL